MIGLLLWKDPAEGKRARAVSLRGCSILQMRFCCAEVLRGERTPAGILRRRTGAAARRLRKEGITQVVLPEDFAFGEQLERAGVRAVSTLPLRRALAAELVQRELERAGISPESVRVAVSGEYLTGEVARTVTELALRYRYVLVDLPFGGEALCRQLRREYGAAPVCDPSPRQLEEAGALVLFRERADLRQKNPVVLRLYEGGAAALPPLELLTEEPLPCGADRAQLASALLCAGALRRSQIVFGSERG